MCKISHHTRRALAADPSAVTRSSNLRCSYHKARSHRVSDILATHSLVKLTSQSDSVILLGRFPCGERYPDATAICNKSIDQYEQVDAAGLYALRTVIVPDAYNRLACRSSILLIRSGSLLATEVALTRCLSLARQYSLLTDRALYLQIYPLETAVPAARLSN